MIIETKRLFLREMKENDLDMLFKVLGDKENMRYYPYVFDKVHVQRWIKNNIERYRVFGFGLWAVCLKESGEMIGDCGITMQNINGTILPEIGYHIRADKQHNGYAKEAAHSVKDWGFVHTPFKILYSYMKADNIASAKTAEAMGMHITDTYLDDMYDKVLVYSINRN